MKHSRSHLETSFKGGYFCWRLGALTIPREAGENWKGIVMKYAMAAIGGMVVLSVAVARGAIKMENVEYKIGDTTFKSVVVYDDAASGKRPGIVVYPEWWGLTDYAKRRAHMLAELGYVAMAVDLFKNRQTTEDAGTAGKWAGALKADRKVLRERANAGLEALKKNPHVDGTKLGAIGYCFGGSTAIELGRSGADVKAIVTFHAALDSPTPADGKNIRGRLLVCH